MSTITTTTTQQAPPEAFAGSLFLWHATSDDTDGTLAVSEAWVRPGVEPPIHIHACEDETFYVLEGEATFLRGTERHTLRAGESIYLPRGVRHGFAVAGPLTRLLTVYTPGGLEEAFRAGSVRLDDRTLPPLPDGPPPPEALKAMVDAFAARGVEFVGPPLTALL